MPMKNPPHPGDFIRTEILEAAGENRANRFAAWLAAVLLLVVAAMKIAA